MTISQLNGCFIQAMKAPPSVENSVIALTWHLRPENLKNEHEEILSTVHGDSDCRGAEFKVCFLESFS